METCQQGLSRGFCSFVFQVSAGAGGMLPAQRRAQGRLEAVESVG